MNIRIKMQSKLAKLVIIVQIIQRCFSNKVRSYFENPDNSSVLIVNNDYDCANYYDGKRNVFYGVQAMIDHLVHDY